MSQQNKENAEQIKKFFKTVKDGSKQAADKSQSFDKALSNKIQKVQEASQEVIKHFEGKK